MEALVLGGSNFIGLHLVQHLHGQGHQITVLNRGQTLGQWPEGVSHLAADRNDSSAMAAALKGRRYDAAYDVYAKPLSGLQDLVELLEGQVGHYIFCSSTNVYAPSEIFPVREDFPKNYSPDMPVLAKAKVASEELLMEFHSKRGFPISVIRPSVVYGPDNNQAKRDFKVFAVLNQGRKVIIPGSGQQLFHPVHVDDLAAMFVAATGNQRTYGQAYTGCGSESPTGEGYVKMVGEIMGVPTEIVNIETSKFDALTEEVGVSSETAVFPYAWRVNRTYTNEKAKGDMDWSPRYNLRDGLAMTYKWWVDQGLDKEPWDFSVEDRILDRVGA